MTYLRVVQAGGAHAKQYGADDGRGREIDEACAGGLGVDGGVECVTQKRPTAVGAPHLDDVKGLPLEVKLAHDAENQAPQFLARPADDRLGDDVASCGHLEDKRCGGSAEASSMMARTAGSREVRPERISTSQR